MAVPASTPSTCRTVGPDVGQVTPLAAVLVAVVAVAALGIVAVGEVLIDRAVARTAADAAALAAAAGDTAGARELAAENGGELVALRRQGDDVEVEVRVGRTRARARATVVREVVPGGEVRGGDPIP